MSKNRILLLFFLILIVLFWISRLWNFERLLTFHSDQGIFFSETWKMVQERKISLIGLKVTTKEVLGRAFYTGPFFYYLLATLGVLINWNPRMITFLFIFIWFLAGLGIFYLTKKICGLLAGITAFGIFATCPYFVFFSRIIWNTALVPLVSVLFFTSLYQIKKNKLAVWWFLAGLFLGLGLNLSHSTLIWFPFLGFFAFWQFKNKILKAKYLGMILAGFILGELPVLIFELRHQFYNTKTFIFFIKYGILEGRIKGAVTDYHFIFALFPLFFLLWGKTIQLVEKKFNFSKAFILSVVLILALTLTINWNQEWGTGMPKGWSLSKVEKVAKIICHDIGNQDFEIAETIDGDTRAYDLRFFLSFFGCPPLGVEDYQQADNLFLVTTQKRLPEKETVWEVKSLSPFKTIFKKDLGDELILFKLSRMNTLLD